ncbi:Glycine cleavage system H protein [Candidatus Magnetaquicoccaceae bacterium FCR-1]|uniref:Glycine cleavage system H protein n=1 Tax=Candidatus Magnetaquiglobus chichijimensis TaxID=3141448 RepID=A0ABQ0C4E7_9PROT
MSEIGEIPRDLRYSREHEWARVLDSEVEVGITAYAAHALGDVVFVELPKVGTRLEQGKPFGVVESVKSVSDLFAPVNGTVSAINSELESAPERVNEAPYAEGWMIRLRPDQPDTVNGMLSADDYRTMLESDSHG